MRVSMSVTAWRVPLRWIGVRRDSRAVKSADVGEGVRGTGRRAGGHQVGQLPGRPLDARAQLAADPAGAPVLRGGEHRGGRDDGVQVGEQRAHRVVEGQLVSRRARRRARAAPGLPSSASLSSDVDERLEQAAVGRREDRRHGDDAVGAGDGVERRAQARRSGSR